jgi:hypothetical protein
MKRHLWPRRCSARTAWKRPTVHHDEDQGVIPSVPWGGTGSSEWTTFTLLNRQEADETWLMEEEEEERIQRGR